LFLKKSLNASMSKKSHSTNFSNVWNKNYPNYRKLAKTKKNCSKH
jgi:hypothetical protein